MADGFCPRLTANVKKPITCQEHGCHFYKHITGTDSDGNQVDEWECIDIINMKLNINLTHKIVQSIASVDKVNNTISELSKPTINKRISK